MISHVNPLSYEVDALRGLLHRHPAHTCCIDFGVLMLAALVGIGVAAGLLDRLAR